MPQKCKVVLFLEAHDESMPCVVLNNLMPFFKEKGFKTLCMEEAIQDKNEALEEYHMIGALYTTETCKPAFGGKCAGLAAANTAKINLTGSLENSEIQYCAMDISTRPYGKDVIASLMAKKLRDTHMADTIEAYCEAGEILALVGFAHYNRIRENLLAKGSLS